MSNTPNTRTRSSISKDLLIPNQDLITNNRNDPIPSPTSSTSSSSSDATSDPSYPYPTTPLSSIRVCHITSELALTSAQSTLIFTLMQSELERAGLLGTMDFRTSNCEDALRPVLTNVKRELNWLVGKWRKLEKGRLSELLRARARIVNEGEKVRRRSRVGELVGEERRSEEKHEVVGVEDRNAEEEEGEEVVVNGLVSEDGAEEPGFADALEEMDVQGATASAQGASPLPTIVVDQPAHTIAHPKAGALRPTSFIIRVANSATGAAIHPLQLTTVTHPGAYVTVDDLSFDVFVQLVSEQVGFDVRGRISAVMPKMFTQFAPIDCKVSVSSDEHWRAVLQAWHDMWQKACHFVIEAEAVED
jgi:hypothetical protein